MIRLDDKEKGPAAILDYRIDWTAALAGATISSVAWDVDGLTNVAASNTTTTATVRISGGSAGGVHFVICTITASDGRELAVVFRLGIVSRIVVQEVVKAPGEVLTLGPIDWTDVLNGDTIASRAWTATGLTTVGGTTGSTLKVDAGTAGVDYYAIETITTTAGQVDARAIVVWVREL
jgi:hypothetical protein